MRLWQKVVIQCTTSVKLIINEHVDPQCVWCLLCWTVCFLKKYIQQSKGRNDFFAKPSKFGEVQTEHLHTCPLHLKLMPTTSLSHILHNEETRDNTFDYSFYSQLKKIAPTFFRLFYLKYFRRLWFVMSTYASLLTTPFLFITVENTSQHFKLSIIGD